MRGLSILPLLLAGALAAAQPPPPESVSPRSEPLTMGRAGDDPADIGRYLLARGAQAAALSPDGSVVALRLAVTGAPQLWTVPARGGPARQLTFGNGVTFFRFAPDGRHILYGADNDGDEREAYTLISVDGASERTVLPPAADGFRTFGAFSPDGGAVYYASTERNGLDYDLYRTELADGRTDMLFQGEYGNFPHALSPDGRWLAFSETVGEDADNLYLLDTRDGAVTVVSRPEPRAGHAAGGIAWTPDSRGFYLASNAGREFAALMRYSLAAAELRPADGVAEAPRDVESVTVCGEDGRWLAWTLNANGFDELHVRDMRAGSMLDPPPLPEGVHALSCGARTSRMVIRTNGWRTPGDVHVWDLADGRFDRVFASNLAGLDPERLVRPVSVRMPARDGVMLQGLLYLPDAASRRTGAPPPVLFEVHGGPTAQSRATFDPVAQYHADRGVAVFEPNVRGSTGFGRTYAALDDRARRLDSVRDLVDMLAFFEEDGRVDASRAAVAGGSYGGYMVNAVLAGWPDAFRAGVSRYGVADWVTALSIASPALKASDRIEYGDINEPEWRSFYEVNSPIRQADRIRVPVLFSHGEMDPRIDIAETEAMVRALRRNGVDAPFIRVPDEGHGWRKLSNRLFYYRRQAEFVESRLGL